MKDTDFNKSVFSPDQIDSIDWTKFNAEDVIMKNVVLPKTAMGYEQNGKWAITLENILTKEECE